MKSLTPFSTGIPDFEDIQKKNMEIFETTMKMFNPFLFTSDSSKEEQISKLSKQINELNKQLNRLKSK